MVGSRIHIRGEVAARTVKAIERKFMNTSAVLDELGLPWAVGLVPNENRQQLLVEAVVNRLELQVAGPVADLAVLAARAAALAPRLVVDAVVGELHPEKRSKQVDATCAFLASWRPSCDVGREAASAASSPRRS